MAGTPVPAHAQEPSQEGNRAAVVVVHADGSTAARCVAFAEPQLTGYELLRRSGLDLNVEAGAQGVTVCRLDGEGCTFPQQSCFCQCEGASCTYWSYWNWEGATWRYANLGASNQVVLPGALQGWVWGQGSSGNAPAPPAGLSFAGVCATPPTPTLTPTPGAADTATPTPHSTVGPTPTWTPTWTPTALPAATATWTPVWTPSPAPAAATVTAAAAPVAAAPTILALTVDRPNLVAGETVVLAWSVTGASQVQLTAGPKTIGVAAAGQLVLAPPESTAYLLSATGPGGVTRAAVSVAVSVTAAPAAGATLPPAVTDAPATAVVAVTTVLPATATPHAPTVAIATTVPSATVPSATPLPPATAVAIAPPTATPVPATAAVPAGTPTLAPVALALLPTAGPASRAGAAVGTGTDTPGAMESRLGLLAAAGVALVGLPLLAGLVVTGVWWMRRR